MKSHNGSLINYWNELLHQSSFKPMLFSCLFWILDVLPFFPLHLLLTFCSPSLAPKQSCFCFVLMVQFFSSTACNMYWLKLTTAFSMEKMQMWRLGILMKMKMSSLFPSAVMFGMIRKFSLHNDLMVIKLKLLIIYIIVFR